MGAMNILTVSLVSLGDEGLSGILLVRDIMTKDVKTVGIDTSVRDAVQKMNKFRIGSVVVMDIEKKRLLGILTERDILRLVELQPEPFILKVKEVMSSPLVTVGADTSIEDAARLMAIKQIKRLPVIDNDRLVGIITSSDIVRASPILVATLTDLLRSRKPA